MLPVNYYCSVESNESDLFERHLTTSPKLNVSNNGNGIFEVVGGRLFVAA
jgi:hypothetical protein